MIKLTGITGVACTAIVPESLADAAALLAAEKSASNAATWAAEGVLPHARWEATADATKEVRAARRIETMAVQLKHERMVWCE